MTWDYVKLTLKQRCVFQCWNFQRQTTSNQRCVFQRRNEQRTATSKQRCHFQQRVKRRSNVVKITISKKNKQVMIQIEYMEFKVLTTIS